MQTYGGVELFLSFIFQERVLGTHWIGDWVAPRAGLDVLVKRKMPCPCRIQSEVGHYNG
jgi:hypothetical protein